MSPADYDREAASAMSRLVARIDPTFEFFTDAAPARAILFPASYALDEAQFRALAAAARAVGDSDGFYLHAVERIRYADPTFPQDWWIALDDYGGYVRAVHLENLVHSPSGGWSFVALESDAVAVAGSHAFLDALLDKWPSYVYGDAIYGPRRQVEGYLVELGRIGYPEVVMRWLPSLLSHMYGEAEGNRLLAVYAAASVTKS